MTPFKPHAFAELPALFHNRQTWDGFNNPSLVQQDFGPVS